MGMYRKKPVVIEARQFLGNNDIELMRWIGESCKVANDNCIVIETLEGDLTANVGDWIIMGVKGEFYPCKPDVFEMTYERVE